MATHSSGLAWRIPGMGEPGGLPSMGSHRVRHDRSDLAAAVPMAPHTFIQLSDSHFVYPRVRDQRETCIMWVGLMQLVKGLKRKKTNIQWRKHSLFNQWWWKNWTATCKRKVLEHFLTPHTKINLKRIKCKARNYKTFRGKVGRTLFDKNHINILFNPIPRVMEIKTKINKWDIIKLKSFCTAKETINMMKRQPSE